MLVCGGNFRCQNLTAEFSTVKSQNQSARISADVAAARAFRLGISFNMAAIGLSRFTIPIQYRRGLRRYFLSAMWRLPALSFKHLEFDAVKKEYTE